jgi:hypothetical protein
VTRRQAAIVLAEIEALASAVDQGELLPDQQRTLADLACYCIAETLMEKGWLDLATELPRGFMGAYVPADGPGPLPIKEES